MLTHDQIRAIRERAEKATAGPWENVPTRYVVFGESWRVSEVGHFTKSHSATCHNPEDADFIANARTDIPSLLAHIEELEKELRDWREESRDLSHL